MDICAAVRNNKSVAGTHRRAGNARSASETNVIIARALGIGRGADLVLYCSVIVMMIGFLMVYARLRAMRRELTLLVRRLAIRDAMGTISIHRDRDSKEPKEVTE